MDRAAERMHVLVGFCDDGMSLAGDLRPCDESAFAEQARRFMADHVSCAAVEVWCDGAWVYADGDTQMLEKLTSSRSTA